MRKQIVKTLTWKKVDTMSYHDIIKEMNFTITEEFTEDDVAAICNGLPCPKEIRRIPVVFGSVNGKMNIITYLYIIKFEYGLTIFRNWDEILTFMNNTRGTDKSVYRIDNHIFNLKLKTVRVDIDRNAFKQNLITNVPEVIDYTDLCADDAIFYLQAVSGLDSHTLNQFCGRQKSKLFEEINIVGADLRNESNWRYEETCKKISKAPKYGKVFCADGSNYVLPCDFVYYLLIIKTVSNVSNVGKSVVLEYFNCDGGIERYRERMLNYFFSAQCLLDIKQSICYKEHLFVLNNYFNIDYVIDPAATTSELDLDKSYFEPSSIQASAPEYETDLSKPDGYINPFVDKLLDDNITEESLINIIKSAIKDGRIKVNINIEMNNSK